MGYCTSLDLGNVKRLGAHRYRTAGRIAIDARRGTNLKGREVANLRNPPFSSPLNLGPLALFFLGSAQIGLQGSHPKKQGCTYYIYLQVLTCQVGANCDRI